MRRTATAGGKLTSKQVARLLGISDASVKRWADSGLLPSEKTAGGHRRFRPVDVAGFQREQEATRAAEDVVVDDAAVLRRPLEGRALTIRRGRKHTAAASSPAKEPSPAMVVETPALFEAFVEGRSDVASAMLINAYLHGHNLASLFDGPIAGAMRRVGDLWYEGELTVAQEHMAARTALSALEGLRRVIARAKPNGLLALCCGVEGDFHELPVQFAELLLESQGWRVVNLGTHTPFFSLAEVLVESAPQIVCVSSTILVDLDRAAREYVDFRAVALRARAAVVLGGAGFRSQQVRKRFAAELYADNFEQLSAFAATRALAGDSEKRGRRRSK